MNALEIKDVTLSFSGVRALRNVSFGVEKGSITAIIGPNGAGKTSIFNCICGVYKPDSGSIKLNCCSGLSFDSGERGGVGIEIVEINFWGSSSYLSEKSGFEEEIEHEMA